MQGGKAEAELQPGQSVGGSDACVEHRFVGQLVGEAAEEFGEAQHGLTPVVIDACIRAIPMADLEGSLAADQRSETKTAAKARRFAVLDMGDPGFESAPVQFPKFRAQREVFQHDL